jgi:signal peptidase II
MPRGAKLRDMSKLKLSLGHKIAIWTVALVLVDQIVKILVHCNMEVGDRIEVLKWFNLCYVENPGFAFGMQLGGGGDGIDWGKIALSIFRLVMIGALIYGIRYLIKKGSEVPKGVIYGAMLILAGAIGNMVDSMFYGLFIEEQGTGFLTGKVIDMVHLPLFKWESCPSFLRFLVGGDGYFFGAVFNVADAYISCAVVYLLVFHYKFFK